MENMFRLGDHEDMFSRRRIWINGPVIVGAGPSGLATAACLKEQGVPFVVLERADCIASLWQKRTYDRLKLHLPKQFCQLPKLPFPQDFPKYITKKQFIEYLESYARHFDINPRFNECVRSARYDETSGLWRITTNEVEYICRWLVVATGENAECVTPDFEGLAEFKGDVIHACDYKSGESFKGKKVLVVGCGNSGMELSLDLSNHNALPSMVVRSSVQVLPREVFGTTCEFAVMIMQWLPVWIADKIMSMLAWLVLGMFGKSTVESAVMMMQWLPVWIVDKIMLVLAQLVLGNGMIGKWKSTFELAVMMMQWLPIWIVDKILLMQAWLVLGNMEEYGLKRPMEGPLELKNTQGKSLVWDNGTLEKIRSGDIKVVPGIKRFANGCVELVNGEKHVVDSVVLATGYRSNVSSWLQEGEFFSKSPFPNGWKVKAGLYAVGFTKRGLSGASSDAIKISQDIGQVWKQETKQKKQRITTCHRRCISQF